MLQIWRLGEAGPDNLGLAFTEDALVLGRTPLIERRSGRYVVRDRMEIERLLKRAYNREPAADWLMTGLATIAAALNANDQCLARIAAVHLKIPNLADVASREAIEVEDALIKSADWNPDLHPRAGVPPNPGWLPLREAQLKKRRQLRQRQTTIWRCVLMLRPALATPIGSRCHQANTSTSCTIS